MLKVDAYVAGEHLLVLFINGLHIHVSLFEEFQTEKSKKKRLLCVMTLCYVLCYYDVRFNGKHGMVGPRRYTPYATHDDFSELYNGYDGTEQIWRREGVACRLSVFDACNWPLGRSTAYLQYSRFRGFAVFCEIDRFI